MDRVRRLAELILERYPDLFTTDFQKNKELLPTVAIIRTKGLRNEIAGYITGLMSVRASEETGGQTLEEVIVGPSEE